MKTNENVGSNISFCLHIVWVRIWVGSETIHRLLRIGWIHSERGIVTITRKHVAYKRNEFMNISWLLIEISQNEKGLHKLTFIINKYIQSSLPLSLSLCIESPRALSYMLYAANWLFVGYTLVLIGRRFDDTVSYCASTRDHNVCILVNHYCWKW